MLGIASGYLQAPQGPTNNNVAAVPSDGLYSTPRAPSLYIFPSDSSLGSAGAQMVQLQEGECGGGANLSSQATTPTDRGPSIQLQPQSGL